MENTSSAWIRSPTDGRFYRYHDNGNGQPEQESDDRLPPVSPTAQDSFVIPTPPRIPSEASPRRIDDTSFMDVTSFSQDSFQYHSRPKHNQARYIHSKPDPTVIPPSRPPRSVLRQAPKEPARLIVPLRELPRPLKIAVLRVSSACLECGSVMEDAAYQFFYIELD